MNDEFDPISAYGPKYAELKQHLDTLTVDNEEYFKTLQEIADIVKRANALSNVEDEIASQKPLFVEGDFIEDDPDYLDPANRSEKDQRGMIVGISRKIEPGIKISRDVTLPPSVEFIYHVSTIFNDEMEQIIKKVSEFNCHRLDFTKLAMESGSEEEDKEDKEE